MGLCERNIPCKKRLMMRKLTHSNDDEPNYLAYSVYETPIDPNAHEMKFFEFFETMETTKTKNLKEEFIITYECNEFPLCWLWRLNRQAVNICNPIRSYEENRQKKKRINELLPKNTLWRNNRIGKMLFAFIRESEACAHESGMCVCVCVQ